jgi:tyrosyl-tRNA synthetase
MSSSEVKRLANQGGIEVNGQTIDNNQLNQSVTPGTIIKVGKKTPFEVK